ncbi:helix-turn-helix domain-containing protein [Tunicatimonas pelagia]|uniref:helix-turn-helix domain-containing protein n=1 Tax=Tunicatimonas pelagia TaxID=931531 RepID=UPI002665F18B|nr:helix-turn-helix domain-containing protein [Tunicatimonas pelagia]WKN41714.1 helix-turn-helix domain-containing protein [Tunicatimonas pelagia]
MPLLFLLASLGVINGSLVGLYLIVKRPRAVVDSYFGGLLLALSIRIGKSVFFYFSSEVDQLILQIGLSVCVFIGPFFYLYSRALQRQEQSFQRKDILLLLFLVLSVLMVGLVYPYRTYPEIWNGYIIYGIYTVWLSFTLLGLYYNGKMLHRLIFQPWVMSHNQQYIAAIALAMLLITATYQTALFVGFTYIWGSLIFSFTFYYLMGRVFISRKSVTPQVPARPLENGSALLNQVDKLMELEKPYTNQKLKLDELAAQVAIPKHTLSRVLNEVYTNGFSHYIKEYRVKEAQRLIATRHDLSLEGIGYEAGFNSKSAFFEAFKKVANCTPAEYKKSR